MGYIREFFCTFILIILFQNYAIPENIKHYFKGGFYELYKPNIPKTLEVKLEVGELEKYIKNLVRAYARGTDLIQKFKRKYNGYIIVDSTNNKSYKAKINITGDHLDHIMPDMKLISSLSVNMIEGNIGGITRFRLLLPGTRHGMAEIFTASLFKTLGFPTLHTQIVKLKFNNYTYDVIFQEKPEKEFLERHGIRETAILEGNEIQWWYNLANKKNNYPELGPFVEGYKVDNSNFLKNKISSIIASTGISYLNLNHNIINHNIFIDALNSFSATHGTAWHNRKYIFVPYMNLLIPIYYDGMGNTMMNTEYINKLKVDDYYYDKNVINEIIKQYKIYIKNLSGEWWNRHNTQEHLTINIESRDLHKFFSHALKNSKFSNMRFELINKNTFKQYSLDNYNKSISKYINNTYINNLVFMKNNQYFHCISNKLDLSDGSHLSMCNKIKYNIYNKYISGKAKPIKNNIQVSELDIYPNYIGLYPPLYGNKKVIYYENYTKNIIEINPNEVVYLKYSNSMQYPKIDVILNQDRNEIGHAVFMGNLPKNMKVIISSVNPTAINRSKISKYNELLLTGCVSFIETKFNSNSIIFNNLPCEDGVNILNSSGHLKHITGNSTKFDGLDIDFSNLSVEEIDIHNSNNDCVDLSGGYYELKDISVTNCKDKGISVGEASVLFGDIVKINKSNIGIASKDSSKVHINHATFIDSDTCYLKYNKKQEFGLGEIKINNLNGC